MQAGANKHKPIMKTATITWSLENALDVLPQPVPSHLATAAFGWRVSGNLKLGWLPEVLGPMRAKGVGVSKYEGPQDRPQIIGLLLQGHLQKRTPNS